MATELTLRNYPRLPAPAQPSRVPAVSTRPNWTFYDPQYAQERRHMAARGMGMRPDAPHRLANPVAGPQNRLGGPPRAGLEGQSMRHGNASGLRQPPLTASTAAAQAQPAAAQTVNHRPAGDADSWKGSSRRNPAAAGSLDGRKPAPSKVPDAKPKHMQRMGMRAVGALRHYTPAALAVGAASGFANTLGTSTDDYRTRLGIEADPSQGPLRRLAGDVGVRALGAATDAGAGLVDTVGAAANAFLPERYEIPSLRSTFRDVEAAQNRVATSATDGLPRTLVKPRGLQLPPAEARGAGAGAQAFAAQTASAAQAEPAAPGNDIRKQVVNGVTQYSGQNIGPDATINGQPAGRMNLGGWNSADTAASAQRTADIYRAALHNLGGNAPRAPVALHSGNDWQKRNELRNAAVSASSLTEQPGYGGIIRKRGVVGGIDGNTKAQREYNALLQADVAAREAEAKAPGEMADRDAQLEQEAMRQQGQGLRDQMKANMDWRTAQLQADATVRAAGARVRGEGNDKAAVRNLRQYLYEQSGGDMQAYQRALMGAGDFDGASAVLGMEGTRAQQSQNVQQAQQGAVKALNERLGTMYITPDGKPDAARVARHNTFAQQRVSDAAQELRQAGLHAQADQLLREGVSALNDEEHQRIARAIELEDLANQHGSGPRAASLRDLSITGVRDNLLNDDYVLGNGRTVPRRFVDYEGGGNWLLPNSWGDWRTDRFAPMGARPQ